MRKTKLISGGAAELLRDIKRIDERVYRACLIAYFTGARFNEMRNLTIGDLKRKYMNLGKGDGFRVVPIHSSIGELVAELSIRGFTDEMYVLKDKRERSLRLPEANRVVNEAAENSQLVELTFSSFRKTFGHRMCKSLKRKEDVILVMGLESRKVNRSSVDVCSIFELMKKEMK